MQLGPERFKANAQAALADRTLKIAIDRTTGTAERKRAEAVAEPSPRSTPRASTGGGSRTM